jgi:signal transduction histidine kinase
MDQRTAFVIANAPVLRGRSTFAGPAVGRSPRIERILGVAFAAVCLVFGGQTLPLALTSTESLGQLWEWTLGVILYAALLVAIVGGLTSRFVRTTSIAVTVSFAAILFTWPFTTVTLADGHSLVPWPWYLCNVATAGAALAFSDLIAIGYALLVSTAYFLVRLTPAGGSVGPEHAALDSGYALILGIGTVLIVELLRRSAARVDTAEVAATARYASATRDYAAERERNTVDALLHDSAMAALLAASRAASPADRRYTVALTRTALQVISTNAGLPPSESVSLAEVTTRFAGIRHELGIEATLSAENLEETSVPATVAEVFFAAALQALMNSAEHAGPGTVARHVSASWAHDELTVIIADDGAGFDTSQPTARLGIRKSIVERLESIGGTATVTSAPGRGTTVTLRWSSV